MKFFRAGLLSALIVFPTALLATTLGPYIGVGVGLATGPNQTLIDPNDLTGSGGSITGFNKDTYGLITRSLLAGNLFAGYNITHYFGVEGSYTVISKQKVTDFAGAVTTSNGGFDGGLISSIFALSGVGYFPLEKMDFFAKLGLAFLNSNFSLHDPNGAIFVNAGNYHTSHGVFGVVYGAGLLYHFLPQWAGRVEFDRVSAFSDNKIGNLSYNQAAIGINYALG